MKAKPFKRLLVLSVSAAMVFGTCAATPATASPDAAAAEDAESIAEDAARTAAYTDDAEDALDAYAASVSDAQSSVTAFAVSAEEQNEADEDDAVSACATLSQDTDGYYLITSADDMEAFAEMVQSDASINGRLTADITLDDDYIPVGSATQGTLPATYYTGTFDGSKSNTENYTVTLSLSSGSYLALFAGLGEGGVIQNLNLAGTVSGTAYCAGAVAYAAGGTIQNVKSSVTVSATNTNSYAAGIVAYSKTNPVSVYACENAGTISGVGYVGGIAGDLYVYGSVLAGCRNTGTVKGTNTAVGGILAYANYNAYVYGCVNTGDVYTTSTSTSSKTGGIVAWLNGGGSSTSAWTGTVQYCFNTGSVAVAGSANNCAGGIVGYYYAKGLTIDQCFNNAEFDNDYGYYGGIAGQIYATSNYITNCYNTSDAGSEDIERAGGIAQYMYYSASITNCYNTGTIAASTYAGALVAYCLNSSNMANVTNCYYLDTCASAAGGRNTISGASAVTSDTLKGSAGTLGDAYKEDTNEINEGYPILTYQDLTVSEVRELMENLDETSSTYAADLGYAYAAYYCLSEEEQEEVFRVQADTLTVTKTVSSTDTNGNALSSDMLSSISDTSYTFTLYKAEDADGTNAAAVSAVSYVITDASGAKTEAVTGSDGSFTLKDGETATFGGKYTATLGEAIDMDTAGYYYVTESDAAGNYETSWTQTSSASEEAAADVSGRTSGFAAVAGGAENIEEAAFVCTNTYVQDVVTVTKTISDAYVSSALLEELNENSYTFILYKTENGTQTAAAHVSYTVYEDGTAGSTYTTGDDGSFTLAGGCTAKFFGADLDTAVTYSVEEETLSGNWTTAWSASSSVTDAVISEDGSSVTVTGSVQTADSIDFICTNTYLADTLTVTATIADKSASGTTLGTAMKKYLNKQSFTFILYVSGTAAANESYSVYEGETLVSTGNVTGTDGSFTLSGGQTASFERLDMTGEVSYSVTETDLDSAFWTGAWSAVTSASAEAVTSDTTSSGSVSLTGTAAGADTVDFTCTNTYAYEAAQIYTLEDLLLFSETVTEGYSPDADVMADIDATVTAADGSSLEPIGGGFGIVKSTNYPNCYSGTFEGNNHTITVDFEQDTSAYYTGLFSGLAEGGVIKNLTVAGTVSGGKYNGGVAAYATGGTIQNVTNEAAVSGTSGGHVGGIVGFVSNGTSALEITDCVNNGAVSSESFACGGICGYGTSETLISGCVNNGAITSTSYSIGGIAGILNDGNSEVYDCFNYGTVTGSYNVGGIAGTVSSMLQYCGNYGAVTSVTSSKATYAGGVVGYLNGSGTSLIDSCFNEADVSGTTRNGGIVGYLGYYSADLYGKVTNCYNTGSVSTTGAYAGGVAGYVKSAYPAIQNCYNIGSVSSSGTDSKLYVGILVGYFTVDSLTNISNNYGLNTAAENVSGIYYDEYYSSGKLTAVDADTLKTYAAATIDEEGNTTASVLGSAFKEDTASYNDGYPILVWEYHTYEASWTWAEDFSTAVLTLTCTDGDDVQTVEATVTSEVTTDAACSAEGVRTYTATATYNGVEYTDAKTEAIAATGHTYGLPAFTWADDCSSVTAAFTCSVCDDVQTVTETDITSTITAATCTEAGLITYAAAVTFEGVEHTATTSVVLEATGHDYDDGVVTTEATCTDDGVLTHTCKNDSSHTYTETIPATGHSYEAAVTEPTCTEGGYTTYTCSVCGDTYTADETAATGHSYEAAVTEPTCTEGGYTTYTCSICGDTYTADETQATGHSYEAAVTEPTCTEGGYTTYTCSICGDTYTADETQATGHNYETVVTEPTCTEGGYTTYTCSVCGDTYTADETEATGHSYGSDGYCTVCGDYSAEADETNTTLPAEDDTDEGTTIGVTSGGSSYAVPSTKISAEKVSLTGATVAQVTQTLAKLTNDGDLADSAYCLLQAKAKKTTKKSVKLSWKKVSGAVTYVVYANACGKSKKLKKYKVTGKTSLNITKIAGKKLTSGKYYKFLVIALDADGKVIQTSKVIHAATKGGSVTNAKSLTLYKSGKKVSSLTLKKGKSAKITAKVTKQDKKKKIKNHRKTKYESSNKKIATVTANGRIKAKAKGTCYIYVYAQNGVSKRIKVTVK